MPIAQLLQGRSEAIVTLQPRISEGHINTNSCDCLSPAPTQSVAGRKPVRLPESLVSELLLFPTIWSRLLPSTFFVLPSSLHQSSRQYSNSITAECIPKRPASHIDTKTSSTANTRKSNSKFVVSAYSSTSKADRPRAEQDIAGVGPVGLFPQLESSL